MGKRGFILVEGVADIIFIRDFINIYYGYRSEGNISNNILVLKDEQDNEMIIFAIGGKNPDANNILKLEQEYNKFKPSYFVVIFDADDNITQSRENIIENICKKQNIEEKQVYLFPNNQDIGDLECFLEKIVKENRILKCWDDFEKCVGGINSNFTIPAKKSKIYTYLEILNPNNRKGKDACKEQNRDYKDSDKWDLRNTSIDYVNRLKSFLDQYLL